MAEESIAREVIATLPTKYDTGRDLFAFEALAALSSSSSHLLQLLLSSYISHHLTNANSEPGAFVFFLWRMSYLALFGAKILAICLLKLLLIHLKFVSFHLFHSHRRRGWKKHFLCGAGYASWPLGGWHLRCSTSYKRKCSYALANSGVNCA